MSFYLINMSYDTKFRIEVVLVTTKLSIIHIFNDDMSFYIINPIVSKQLFSTMLNVEGYRYGINSPISLQFLQLESYGSQLSGAKNRTVLSCMVQILLQREYEKVVKNQKRSAHCKMHVKKIYTFLQISQESDVIT
jgi:hypothetical protein